MEELPESFPQCALPNVLHTGVGEPATSLAQLSINPVHVEGLPESFPQILQHPELKAVEKGRNAIMHCTAKVSSYHVSVVPLPLLLSPILIQSLA